MQKNAGLVVRSTQEAPATQAVDNARKQVKAAKVQVKWLKAQLKQARAAVRAAKDLRKQAEAAEEAARIVATPKRAGVATARKKKVVRTKPVAGKAKSTEPVAPKVTRKPARPRVAKAKQLVPDSPAESPPLSPADVTEEASN